MMHASKVRTILFVWAAMMTWSASAMAQFSTAVLTSQTQTVFTNVAPPQYTNYSMSTAIIDNYTIGPDARFFQPSYDCMGAYYADSCSVWVTFSPAIVPYGGAQMSATLVVDYLECFVKIVEGGSGNAIPVKGSAVKGVKPHGVVPPSCGDNTTPLVLQAQIPLSGTVSGRLPTVGPQMQFNPPVDAPLVAAPAGTQTLTVDSGGNLFVGTATNVLEYSGGSFLPVAGSGSAGHAGDGGPALSAEFNGVTGILQGPGGGLLVADETNREVRSMSVGGNIQQFAGAYYVAEPYTGTLPYPFNTCPWENGYGTGGYDNGPLNGFGVCYGVFPQDQNSSDGYGPPGYANDPLATMSGPAGLATDGVNVFIAEPQSDTVEMVTAGGILLRYAGAAGCGGYNFQTGTDCVFYNQDGGDGDTAAVGTVGGFANAASNSGNLYNPTSLAVDPYANLFIASGWLRMVNTANIISTPMVAGNTLPSGPMVFDHGGDLFIGQNQVAQGVSTPTIQKVTFDNNANPTAISTWANTGFKALAMGTHGEVIAYDGTNINVVGAQGTLNFLTPDPGQKSQPLTATISNPGDQNLIITSANIIAGANAGDFAIASDNCTGATVVPGGSCAVSVTFTPSGTQAETATIAVQSNASSGSLSPVILLNGTAAAAPYIANYYVPPSATEGVPLSQSITVEAGGGSPPYTFTSTLNATNGVWTQTQNGATLTISGTPHVTGNYPFTVTATDSGGLTAPLTVALHVTPITIPAFGNPYAQLGYPFTLTGLAATGGVAPYSYSVSFPAGSGQWTIAPGVSGTTNIFTLTGYPAAAGNISYTITATDSYGSKGTYPYTLPVYQGAVAPQIFGTETIGTSSTSVSYSGTLLLGGLSSFYPGQALPTGTVQFSLDGQPLSPVAVAAGVTQAMTLSTDILYHALTLSNYSGDGNYYSNTNYSALFNINGNRAQSITFPGYPIVGYLVPAGSTFALTAHASSGLPVTYQVISGDAMLDASGMNLIFGPSVGQVLVQASQAGDGVNFAAASNFTATFTTY